jgi:uncharacterized protein
VVRVVGLEGRKPGARIDEDHGFKPRKAARRGRQFGSRARGDARGDSDYDVAVFLKDLHDRWAEADRIALLTSDILEETGAVIHAMPYRAGSYRERTPLMHELRLEGVDL